MSVSWALHSFADGARSGSGDADEPVYAASLIKLPVLLAVFLGVDRGSFALREEFAVSSRHRVGGTGWLAASECTSATVETLARAMIDSSDNAATNVLLDAVGYDAVAEAIALAGLRGTVQRRHMMDVAARAAGRENLITAHDACRVLVALVSGSLLSPASQALAASALRDQHSADVLPRVVPAGHLLGHKTGELDGVRHDAGVLWPVAEPDAPVAAVAVLGTCELGSEDALLAELRHCAADILRELDGPAR